MNANAPSPNPPTEVGGNMAWRGPRTRTRPGPPPAIIQGGAFDRFFPGAVLNLQVPPGYVDPHNFSIQSALPQVNVVSYGADPSGVADSTAAIQNAVNAAAALPLVAPPSPANGTVAVYLPAGNYLVSSPLAIPATMRVTGDGAGSRIFSTASGLFDFQNTFINNFEIDHLTLDATGGHIFTNFNLHRSAFHDLTLIQRSGAFALGTLGASGTGLSTTDFDNIIQYVYCDPSSGVRSIAGWQLFDNTGSGKNLDVLMFRKIASFNQVNNSKLDNTQYIFDIACQVAGAGGLADRITFQQCDFGATLGGGIRLRSVQGAVIDQPGFGNIFNQQSVTIGNSLIFAGQFAGAAVGEGPVIKGYVRENSGTITFGAFSDIEVQSTTTNATIITPVGTGALTNPPIKINLNGSLGAVIIGTPANLAATISNPAADTTIIGNGTVSVGGRAVALANAPAANTQPANPAATASVTLVMMGLAVAYTPTGSGKVAITVTGSVFTLTAAVFGNYGGRYGTGTAPTNGTAVTGTRFGAGADPNFRAPSVGATVPAQFALTDVITGLTPNTAYWFDLALSTSNAADSAQMQNISVSIAEVS